MRDIRGPWRHELTPVEKGKTDAQLVATLDDGVGLSIWNELLWDVIVRRGQDGKPEYLVTQVRPDDKPIVIYGPLRDRAEAIGWARLIAEIFRVEKLQAPQWPWE